MDGEHYRREVLAHAEKLGFFNPRHDGSLLHFTCKPNYGTSVPAEPGPDGRRSLTNAKIALTCCMRAYHPDSLPPPKERKEYRPSRNILEPWLHVWSPDAHTFSDDREAGKWMMFMSRERVDETWGTIKREVRQTDSAITRKYPLLSN